MVQRLILVASVLCAAALVLTWSTSARAYPWMIRHEYGGCATCHADPSGAGVLTPYGRAQSAVLLSSRYGAPADEEPGRSIDFLFGVLPTSDVLLLEGWFRNGYIWNATNGKVVDSRLLQMEADLGANVSAGAFRAGGKIGYNGFSTATYSQRAWVTSASSVGNLVSREHWAGVSIADDAVLVRAGRMNLPFGLRNIEHTSWVRFDTRTDFDEDQQHGVAVSYSSDRLRGEIMGIAGNFQVNPDAYRERGYAAFAELVVLSRLALGASSLVTHANADIVSQKNTTRQAHGVFVRAAPWRPLALLGEFDALVISQAGDSTRAGFVGFAQADVEPIQGIHGILTGEALNQGGPGESTSVGGWLGVAWFAAPHVDARFDTILRSTPGTPTTTTLLLQLHVYL